MSDTTIEYFNFASYRHAKITIPENKLILIKGENNNGKSVLFYGLEWLLFNDSNAKSLINNIALKENPKAELKVIITKDILSIEITRSIDNIIYTINDSGNIRKHKKIGKSNIFILEPNLKIPGILYIPTLPNQILNMHGEDKGIFPFDQNDQGIFTLFEKLLGLINSKKVITEINAELAEYKASLNMVTNLIKEYTIKTGTIKNLFENIDIVQLNNLFKQIQFTKNKLAKLNDIKVLINQLLPYINIEIPNIINITNIKSLLIKQTKLLNSYNIVNKLAEEIKQTHTLNTLDIAETINYTNKWTKLYSAKNNIQEQTNTLIELERLLTNKITELNNLKNDIKNIDTCPLCGHTKIKEKIC